MGAPILAGTDCPDLRTLAAPPPKALVNRRFVELFAKGRNLVGQHIQFLQDLVTPGAQAMEIVGVAGDLREDALNVAPGPYLYVCISPGGWPDPEYVVRAHGSPGALEQAIRPIAHQIDPARAVFGVKTVPEVLNESLDEPRLKSRVVTVFALAAMLLASVGLYSLVTLVVTARTREIGVRMTLGAEPRQIVGQLVAGVARLLAIGAAAGLLLTWMADRILRSLLFGVNAHGLGHAGRRGSYAGHGRGRGDLCARAARGAYRSAGRHPRRIVRVCTKAGRPVPPHPMV
jgi:putative ABC transport system permease protein